MIRLENTDYKVCYLDTNILRATLEMSQSIHINTILKLKEKNIFAISVISLVEISHRQDVIDKFIKFINAIPILILEPSSQILIIEKEKYNQKISIADLILLVSNPLIPQNKKEIIQFIGSDQFQKICHILKNDQTVEFFRIQKEIEKEKEIFSSPEAFVKRRLNLTIGNKYDITLEDCNFLSQKIINLLLYYTYKHRKKKVERSAPFDFLISGAVPYVDVFITENSQAKTFNMIKDDHNIIDSVSILTMKDLRESKNKVPNSR